MRGRATNHMPSGAFFDCEKKPCSAQLDVYFSIVTMPSRFINNVPDEGALAAPLGRIKKVRVLLDAALFMLYYIAEGAGCANGLARRCLPKHAESPRRT